MTKAKAKTPRTIEPPTVNQTTTNLSTKEWDELGAAEKLMFNYLGEIAITLNSVQETVQGTVHDQGLQLAQLHGIALAQEKLLGQLQESLGSVVKSASLLANSPAHPPGLCKSAECPLCKAAVASISKQVQGALLSAFGKAAEWRGCVHEANVVAQAYQDWEQKGRPQGGLTFAGISFKAEP